jgi:hypothetical protein
MRNQNQELAALIEEQRREHARDSKGRSRRRRPDDLEEPEKDFKEVEEQEEE